jgi:hypothetical protein
MWLVGGKFAGREKEAIIRIAWGVMKEQIGTAFL